MLKQIINLRNNSNYHEQASQWFHNKWGVPKAAYLESIEASSDRNVIPNWYIGIGENDEIVCGAGVINNDFHERTDLSPNVCALYVEKQSRGNGFARELLNYIEQDLRNYNVDTLYLITDHVSLYEKMDWKFITITRDDDGNSVRLYEKSLK